jgi:hypothetical protein
MLFKTSYFALYRNVSILPISLASVHNNLIPTSLAQAERFSPDLKKLLDRALSDVLPISNGQ